jgi:hypothetical protein
MVLASGVYRHYTHVVGKEALPFPGRLFLLYGNPLRLRCGHALLALHTVLCTGRLLVFLTAGFPPLVAPLRRHRVHMLGQVGAVEFGRLGVIALAHHGRHVVTIEKGPQLRIPALEHGQDLVGRPVIQIDRTHHRHAHPVGTMASTTLQANQGAVGNHGPFGVGGSAVGALGIAREVLQHGTAERGKPRRPA